MTQEITTLYKFGFYYGGVLYAWKNKKLYKMPYLKNKRSYDLKQIPIYCFRSTLVANIQREKLTINKLKSITKEINYNLITLIDDGMPF